MKTFASVGVSLALLLAGCSSASIAAGGTSPSGGTSGGTGGSGGTTGAANLAQVGARCAAVDVVDVCATAGLVCDLISQTCRKPQMGEQCKLDVGCNAAEAPNPPNLTCVTANLNGTEVNICLVACVGTDSTSCPYGMSCYSNYCKAQAPASCVPGEPCPLAQGVEGQCLANGMSSTCFATGDLRMPYEPCNPFAMNSQADQLCALGFICRATALTLGGFADAGFCFPLCGQGCQTSEHCAQPRNAFYQICRPGISCSIDLDTCPAPESVCVPDDASNLGGGCLPITGDAGEPGASCELPTTIPETTDCQEGACLPADGGPVCTLLCDRTAGGRPYCSSYTCSPLGSDSSASEVVGACR